MAEVVRKIICTDKAAKAVGAYNQAVIVDKTMYISGQIGLDPSTMSLVSGGVEEETRQALNNMGAILEAAGIGFENVVKATIILNDVNDFWAVNSIYSTYFPSNSPARAAFQAAKIPKGALVEIEAIAVVGKIIDSTD